MAGGEGIRLRPLTYMVPKPLLPFGNLTVIEHSIKRLSQCGVKEIFILTSYQNERFSECLEYQPKYGVKIHLLSEPEKLGTVGGLYYIREKLKNPFILMNGDLITNLNFSKLIDHHTINNRKITICVKEYEYTLPYGLVNVDNDGLITKLEEKPKYVYLVNAGIYLINPEILKYLNGKKIHFTEFLNVLLKVKISIGTYLVEETWIDMGHVQDYEAALTLLEEGDVKEYETPNCWK